jgi:DNA polymerase V
MKPIPAGKNPERIAKSDDYKSSGFPSPAEDHEETPLDLHDLAVVNPLATYFMRADTDSMREAGISRGDLLVVDRSIVPSNNQIVVAILDDTFQLKQVQGQGNNLHLKDDSHVIETSADNIWGVVTFIVRQM